MNVSPANQSRMPPGRRWRSMSPILGSRWNSLLPWATGCRSRYCFGICVFRWRTVLQSGHRMVWRHQQQRDKDHGTTKEISMTDEANIPLLDHELADDELTWMHGVYADFGKLRAGFAGRETEFDPKQALRDVLGQEKYRLAAQADLSGPGPW